MVNDNELKIVEKYEAQGWRTLRGGAPDFLFLKVDNRGEIEDFVFVEVKNGKSGLSYAQAIYREVLELLGAKFKVEVPIANSKPYHAAPTQTNPNPSIPTQAPPNQARPCQSESIQAIPPRPRPFQSRPYHTNPYPSKPRHIKPSQPNPVHAIPSQAKPFQKEVRINGIEART